MTYIIHADYQPLNYIISGIDSSQIKEICLKDIKDTLLLRCVRGLLRRLGLYWFFRSLYIRSESLEQRKRLSKYIFYSSFSLLTFATKK